MTINTMKRNKTMTRKNNTRKRHSDVPIITSSDEIICSEKPIRISDEKLKNSLSHAYEQGRMDATKSHWYNHYATCFSFGIAFLIPLLTTDIKNEIYEKIFWILCSAFLLVGIIMIVWTFVYKDRKLINETTERDLAVENIMKNNILTPTSPEIS